MPGPTTEVLSDDLKDLRSDFHKMEVLVLNDVHNVQISVASDMNKLEVAVARLAAEFGVFKWLLGLTLAASVSGLLGSAFWAGSVSSRVGALEGRVDKVESSLVRIDARLDRIESSLARVVELAEKGKSGDALKK